MATDATGTPTSLGIRKYNTSADAPSGLGFNGAMDDIDALLIARIPKTLVTTTGDIIYASGANTPARLGIGSTGQVLTVAGGVPAWAAAAAVSYRKATSKTVNTTVAATDLLNGEITVAAGALGTTGVLRLTAWGDYLQNSGGAAAAPRFQVVLGGTTLIDTGTTAASDAASAVREPFRISVELMNTGAANAQMTHFLLNYMTAGGTNFANAFTTGEGIYQSVYDGAAARARVGQGFTTSAVDMATSKTLVLNVINGSASASYETKLFGALVEVV